MYMFDISNLVFLICHDRSPSSFEFGLGSFSLLEEILTGQEWARFLNPSQVDTLANQTPAQLETSQRRSQDHESGRSTMTLDRVSQSGNVNSQWDFRQSELDQSYDRSADVSSSVNMNITEQSPVQEQNSKCELIQSAPKEYGHVLSQTSSDEVRPNHIPVLEFSFIKVRFHSNLIVKFPVRRLSLTWTKK